MSETKDLDLLELYENQPTTVFVRYFPKNTPDPQGGQRQTDAVGFATAEAGPYHLDGIHWHNIPPSASGARVARQPKSHGSAKFLTMVLEAPLVGIDCDLRYSPKIKDAATQRDSLLLCIPSGEYQAGFHFVVSKDDPKLGVLRIEDIDPQIIVTPVTAPMMT